MHTQTEAQHDVIWQAWPLIIAGLLGATVMSFAAAAWLVM